MKSVYQTFPLWLVNTIGFEVQYFFYLLINVYHIHQFFFFIGLWQVYFSVYRCFAFFNHFLIVDILNQFISCKNHISAYLYIKLNLLILVLFISLISLLIFCLLNLSISDRYVLNSKISIVNIYILFFSFLIVWAYGWEEAVHNYLQFLSQLCSVSLSSQNFQS